MMIEQYPTVVVVYDLGSGRAEMVAVFRLTQHEGVVLDVADPQGCLLARAWFDDGIEILGEARRVLPRDGAEFMKALLQPFRMSYYRFVDESPHHGHRP
ncbi:hypothetical protein [Nocardia sp. NPDC004260]